MPENVPSSPEMSRFVLIGLLGAAFLAPQAARASGQDDEAAGLTEVVVSATRDESPLLEVPASASVVSEEEIGLRDASRLGDAIVEVPGVYARGAALGGSFPGSGQAVLSLRGIPRTPRTLVMIDGLPINNALSGGVNVAGIPIDSLERVEVMRGPYSALWGGNAMGGVVNFITASPDRPLAELRAGLGSDGLRTGNAVLRRRFAGGLGVSMSFGYRSSDGYAGADHVVRAAGAGPAAIPVTGARPTFGVDGTPAWWVGLRGARPWTQRNAYASFDWKSGSATRVTAGFGWGEYEVGYRRPETFLLGPAGEPVFTGSVGLPGGRQITLAERDFLTATPSHERDARLFARLEHRLGDGSLLKVNLGRLEHRFGFSSAGRSAGYGAGPGELTAQPNDRTDLDASWRKALGEATILTTGFALNHSSLDRTTHSLGNWRDEDSTTALLTRADGESDNIAVFAQTETFVGERGRLVLGARYDRFSTSGTVFDAGGGGFRQEHAKRSFSRLSPKAAFAWRATDALTLRSSLGAGFRPPALLDLYSRFVVPRGAQQIVFDASPDLKPERVLAFDLGADLSWANGGRASVTLYAQQLRDLIYRRTLSPTLTRPDNTGEARVDGVEASLRAPAGLRGLTVFGSLTHNFRYEVTRNEALPASVGKRLTDVPRTMWSLGATYESGPWTGLLVYRHVSHVFGSSDDMNLNTVQGVYESYDSHGVASLNLQYRFTPQWSTRLAIENLTDEAYFVFYEQSGRSVSAELAYRF